MSPRLARPAAARRLDGLRDELWRLIVELDLGREGRAHVGIVAACEHEGASTVARALALASVQRVRQRPVLVDADPHKPRARRPSLAGEMRRARGLTDWTPSEPVPLVRSVRLPDVDVLPIGRQGPATLSAMLADGRFAALVTALAGPERSLVVWDLPAIRRHPDAKAVLKALDGAILVAEADRALQSDVRFAADEIRGADVPLIGAVLNRAGRYPLGMSG